MPIAAAEVSQWSDLFVASAGATAALAGLVFVAISINLERILAYSGVAELGLVTLLLLSGVLVVSMFGLIPAQSERTFGTELLIQSTIWSLLVFRFAFKSMGGLEKDQGHALSRLLLPLFGTVPYLVGGILLVTGGDSGMYWVFAGMLGAIIAAVMNAWILLVEILR